MLRTSVLCALALLATIAPASRGQDAKKSTPLVSPAIIAREANAALEAACTPDGPGAAVLIAQGDQILYRNARGMANIELGVPLTTDSVFRIASVTKTFTAAMILKFAESGKLKLDDPLSTYLPDFPNAAGITIREMLNHTSGISDVVNTPTPGFSRRDLKAADLVAEIAKRPLDFAPGTQFRYSNAGFILLGAVIEKITGKTWYVAIQQQLLQSLGIIHTQFGAGPPIIPARAAGYSTNGSTHTVSNAAYINASFPAAAGGLVSTLDDLHLWIRSLNTGHVINAVSLQQMTTPPDLPGPHTSESYGLGMYLWRVRGLPFLGHSGDIDGFTSTAAYLPNSDVTVIVLANDDNFDAQTMARRLAAIALGQPYLQPTPVPISDRELESLTGKYQLDPDTIETLSVKDGNLYAQRGNRNLIQLQMAANHELHFVPDELSYFIPVRDTAGHVTRLDYFFHGDGPPRPLPRNSAVSTPGLTHTAPSP
jgi:D-alanyl-D-alanine carboxypeptidase